jgi:hypothetical protein
VAQTSRRPHQGMASRLVGHTRGDTPARLAPSRAPYAVEHAGQVRSRARLRLPRDPPVGARVRPPLEVGRTRHVRAAAHLHRVRRPLRPGALRGSRAALPEERLPGRCARRCPTRSRPMSSTRSSNGSARRSARPTRACWTMGGADRPGVRRSRVRRDGGRGDAAAAADHGQLAHVHGDGPQRDVPGGAAGIPGPFGGSGAAAGRGGRSPTRPTG